MKQNNNKEFDNNSLHIDSLSKEDAVEELKRLSEVIIKHNKLYFEKSSPIISDAEYDKLWLRNKKIEEKFPELKRNDSPSNIIGSSLAKGFKKVEHSSPMLSLNNAFSKEDIYNFLSKIQKFLNLKDDEIIEVVAEPKIDGVSASLKYEKGVFVQGSTRGDGMKGEDVTANLKTVPDIPIVLKGSNLPEVLEIRGEIYMRHSDFQSLNLLQEKEGKPLYSNPRNSASGSLRQLNPDITKSRKLHFFGYAIANFDQSMNFDNSHWEIRKCIQEFGFKLNKPAKKCSSVDEVITYYNKIEAQRQKLEFDIDGVVYKLDRLDWQKRTGEISRSPRWAIAHKFPAEHAQTKLIKIDIQVGRTGSLTPVARLEPVNIGGVIVTNATLHNSDEIKRKDIRIGDTVVVQRAGDVIPQITKVIKQKRTNKCIPYIFPEKCPICGKKATREKLGINKFEKVFRCTGGLLCSAQIVERLRHFVSLDAFNIEGLGAKQIETLWLENRIKLPSDIFKLKETNGVQYEKLEEKDGWGMQSVENLFNSIEKRRTIALDRFIFSLGIRHVGQKTSRTLALNYTSIFSLLDIFNKEKSSYKKNIEYLTNIDGVGEKVASSLVNFFNEKYNVEIVNKLISELHSITKVQRLSDGLAFSGKSMVFTGVLDNMSRQEAKSYAEKLGAKVVSTVSKNTDIIVAGKNSGSKLKKAQELGIAIVDEKQWKIMITNNTE
tara:strand:+ start:657 stop:2804 length:2148 start_codon:yes stop_codon:yes gene_type:complete